MNRKQKLLAKLSNLERMFSKKARQEVDKKCGHITGENTDRQLWDAFEHFRDIWLNENNVEEWEEEKYDLERKLLDAWSYYVTRPRFFP